MFKSFNDFMNQFFKFSIFMFIFVMSLWLFSCAQESFGAEELPAPQLTLMPADEPTISGPIILIDEDIPGQKHWGHTAPTVKDVKLEDGMLYIVYRQFPMFSYGDERPPDHVYREVYHADFDAEGNWAWPVIKLFRVENAKVTPPQEIPEKLEW
jgi:hypothetical protein